MNGKAKLVDTMPTEGKFIIVDTRFGMGAGTTELCDWYKGRLYTYMRSVGDWLVVNDPSMYDGCQFLVRDDG